MIAFSDLLVIIGIAITCGAAVGALGMLALWFTRRSPIWAQLWVIVFSTIASMVAGMMAAANAMYVSAHDLQVLLYIAGLAALSSLGVAFALGRSFSRNSRRLLEYARAMSENRSVQLPSGRNGSPEFFELEVELASANSRLNEARARLNALDASRREFFAWISHDLRTPLAGLRAMTEALDDQLADDPKRFHRQMLSQVDQLSAMVDDLFELSKIQSGTLTLNVQPVSLYDLVSDAVAELSPVARARSVTIAEVLRADSTVAGDPRELSRVVGNLLMNAIQHSPPGTEIRIATLRGPDNDAVLTIEDAGGGIPENDLPNIFEAGWRGTASRTPEREWSNSSSSGAGLGLAIVHGIIAAHRGEVSVRNVPGGCRFDVTLPLHEPVAA
ncbi:sensor histidine kinase [Rhodoglobus sp.]